ncbi:MAG: NlpC/P60 family protein [Gordonia sp. (in: high G+C Gram-positive bacteria)]|uniref:C40 family peptidase n=1 Tax=Gordonia sp. (in: high G+C Gram-positive bacteria) TaxID=84139 RepID=UPI0039E4B496
MDKSRNAGRRSVSRRGMAVLAAGAASVSLLTCVPTPAVQAEPARSADQLLKRYKQLSVQAEKSSEALNKAQDDYDKQRKIVVTQRKAAADAEKRRVTADKQLAVTQKKIDALARASERGARVNRLYALLVSDSPQSLLDNMSNLEVVSRQAAGDMASIKKTSTDAAAAKTQAEETAAAATAAQQDAKKKRADLIDKQADLQAEASTVRAIYQSMTGQQLAALRGPKFDFDPSMLPKGTSPAMIAVKAALTRIGDPYVWGATGPDAFDCSGLMVWAYKQAGKSLPRTSEAQLAGGTPVSRDALQPGDLIIYYSGASHVGMYVGDGYVVHAATFGVPVAVVPIDQAGPYNAAVRY